MKVKDILFGLTLGLSFLIGAFHPFSRPLEKIAGPPFNNPFNAPFTNTRTLMVNDSDHNFGRDIIIRCHLNNDSELPIESIEWRAYRKHTVISFDDYVSGVCKIYPAAVRQIQAENEKVNQ